MKRSILITLCICGAAIIAVPMASSYNKNKMSNTAYQKTYLASHQTNGPNNRKMGAFYMKPNAYNYMALSSSNRSNPNGLYKNYFAAQNVTYNANAALPNTNLTSRTLNTPTPTRTTLPQTTLTENTYENQIFASVNQERTKSKLKTLTKNTALSEAARVKAYEMRDKNYFDHNSPVYGSPSDMISDFGVVSKADGENIAKGQGTPQEVVTEWMDSPSHKANILNEEFTQTGIGYVTNSAGTTYWVQLFTKP